MLLAWQFILAAILSSTLSVPAFATIVSCENALKAFQLELGDNLKTESYFEDGKGDAPTVHVVGELPGRHGGKRLKLRRTGARWISDYRSVDFDPQGDPRWFIELLGPEAAVFFGFKILTEDQMLVPDEAEFNGAIRAINLKLGAHPIAVQYYSSGTDGNNKVKDYICSFKDHGAIPIAAGGNHLIHDLSFHSGAIFLPPGLVELKQKTEAYLEEFIAYLLKTHGSQSAAVKYYAYLWRYHETKAIDNGTALVNAGIVGYLRNSETSDGSQNLRHAVGYMANYGLNPKEQIGKLIEGFDEKIEKRSIYRGYFNQIKLLRFLTELDVATLKRDLANFHKSYDPEGLLSEQPFWGLSDRVTKDEFCIQITERRSAIRAAAVSLSRAAP